MVAPIELSDCTLSTEHQAPVDALNALPAPSGDKVLVPTVPGASDVDQTPAAVYLATPSASVPLVSGPGEMVGL